MSLTYEKLWQWIQLLQLSDEYKDSDDPEIVETRNKFGDISHIQSIEDVDDWEEEHQELFMGEPAVTRIDDVDSYNKMSDSHLVLAIDTDQSLSDLLYDIEVYIYYHRHGVYSRKLIDSHKENPSERFTPAINELDNRYTTVESCIYLYKKKQKMSYTELVLEELANPNNIFVLEYSPTQTAILNERPLRKDDVEETQLQKVKDTVRRAKFLIRHAARGRFPDSSKI